MTTNVLQRWTGAVRHQATDILTAEPEAVYRARRRDHLGSHALADFRRCPQLYRRKQLGLIPDEDRPAYVVGRAAHTLILEGRDTYRQRYAFGGPLNPKTGKPFGVDTKAFAQWADEQGKPSLSDDQSLLIERMGASVHAHDYARGLLSAGIPEGVARAEYGGVTCQARIDWFNPERGLVDLKTVDRLDWFCADARTYGYAHQLAFYRSVLLAAGALPMRVFLIAVEKHEPFRCGVWELTSQVLTAAENDNRAAIERLKRCRATDSWPTGYEEPRDFDLI